MKELKHKAENDRIKNLIVATIRLNQINKGNLNGRNRKLLDRVKQSLSTKLLEKLETLKSGSPARAELEKAYRSLDNTDQP